MNRENRNFDDTYWRERNDRSYEDRSILRYLPQLNAAIADLRADPVLGPLHDTCVRLHRDKRDQLMTDPTYAGLYGHLRDLPPYPPGEFDLMTELGLDKELTL